jgi:thiosulfate/3-mercaptopyruvate sulfurtransferase
MGWQLYGETRGGHIPRAINIPYAWFYNSDKTTLGYKDLKALLESRGVTPDKEVTSHCTAGIRSGYVYFLLRLMGYSRCSNYDASIWDWADNTTLPMEKAPNYATAVYPAWVKALIDYHKPGSTSAAPPQYSYDRAHKYLVFETQWGTIADMQQGWADNSYLLGHIPGAIHSNSDTYENGFPRWFMLPDNELKAAVGSMGVTPDTTVVVYSDSTIFSARLWWILKYAGVTDVRFLNGGIQQWTASGYPVETVVNNPVVTTYNGTINAAYIATTPYVAANYGNTGTTQLVDVRAGSEYTGMISGYGYLVNKGRIPNSIWAYNADDSSLIYRDNDGTLRSYEEVKSLWSGLGIKATVSPTQFDKEVIFYCGGGYRSSLTFFYAHLMGYTNIRNYSDGWSGWSTTYTPDSAYVHDPLIPGSTDGWRQDPSGRPFLTGGL